MKVTRRIIEIDEELCNGCGECIPSCAEGALSIVDGKARLVAERYCDGLGACLGQCPTGALRIIEREAEDFDEAAVEAHLQAAETAKGPMGPALACGCPSSHVRGLSVGPSCEVANAPFAQAAAASLLSHWPVQIRLVPVEAPFLKGADLLVAADCTAVAYPGFHSELLRGRVVLLGCPKFDDASAYLRKFTEIFREADIRGVTTVSMEVPCCSGLPRLVERAMKAAGKAVPLRHVVISTRGAVLEEMEGPAYISR